MGAERIEGPWYRVPWPWFLIAGPAIVVVASLSTAVIAVRSDDGLVADDYYRRGIAINRTLARGDHARALGLAATLQVNEARDRVRVLLSSAAPIPAEALRLTMTHGTRAGLDQSVLLARTAPGVYEGPVRISAEGGWSLRLEDDRGTWRLSGRWRSTTAAAALGPEA